MTGWTEISVALLTLTAMEIVLGIDNVVFIAILAEKLPKAQRPKARKIGLLAAMVMRILMLLGIGWVIQLSEPLVTVAEFELTGRDLFLIVGGLFLIGKATYEIHHKLEGEEPDEYGKGRSSSFGMVIGQIAAMDMVFSIDSVLTAVGMADQIWVMIVAVVVSIIVMMVFAKSISDFVSAHPTVKMLALSFLLLIGVMLLAEGFHAHIGKGYIYSAMGFSLFVELLNLRAAKKRGGRRPVHIRQPTMPADATGA